MDIASKSFYNVMKETYEPEWKEEDKLKETIQVRSRSSTSIYGRIKPVLK